MAQFVTVFSSLYPMDCYLLKGRLETEGLNCFIYDENTIWVHPFYSNIIGWVKLKVPYEHRVKALEIIWLLEKGKLKSEDGENYFIEEALEADIEKQNAILNTKAKLRQSPSVIDHPEQLENSGLTSSDIDHIIEVEKLYQGYAKTTFILKDFWYELFDPSRNFFNYIHPKPVAYFLEKELVENFQNPKDEQEGKNCPICFSTETRKGFAIDTEWHVLHLLLSFFFGHPFPLIRKNNHCFECGNNF